MRLFGSAASEHLLAGFEAPIWGCSGWKDSFNMVGAVHSISKEELSKGHLPGKLIFTYSSEYTSPDVFTLFKADDLQTSHILRIYFSLHCFSI